MSCALILVLRVCCCLLTFWTFHWIDLMPDKQAGSWRACGLAEMLPRMQNQCFWRSSPSLLLSFFPNIRDCFLRKKKRKLATQFSFLCMSTTVSGSNSWSFAIIGDQSLEVWQRASRMTGDTDPAKSSKLFFPFFFLFTCFLIFLRKAFSERNIALEIFPKKDVGTLQITVQSMTNATFETVGQEYKGRQFWPVWPPTKKKCLYLYFLALLYFFQALLMAKVSYHCLKNTKGWPRYL